MLYWLSVVLKNKSMERKYRDQVLAQSTEVFNLSKYSAINWTDYFAK